MLAHMVWSRHISHGYLPVGRLDGECTVCKLLIQIRIFFRRFSFKTKSFFLISSAKCKKLKLFGHKLKGEHSWWMKGQWLLWQNVQRLCWTPSDLQTLPTAPGRTPEWLQGQLRDHRSVQIPSHLCPPTCNFVHLVTIANNVQSCYFPWAAFCSLFNH